MEWQRVAETVGKAGGSGKASPRGASWAEARRKRPTRFKTEQNMCKP